MDNHADISETLEDYLKAYLSLSFTYSGGVVPLGKLSERLGLSPGTVTTMVKRFAEAGWMEYYTRRGCSLTAQGLELAVSTLRRHRIVESFLVTTLEMGWDEVHREAEVMEHAISEKVVERLDAFLGYPSHDPHGKRILRSVDQLEAVEE